MGIGDNMRGFASNLHDNVKSSSLSLLHFGLRIVTGFFMGLTFAFIGQELLVYGTFALIFFTTSVLAVITKVLKPWKISQILIFDLIVILVAMLLRMYILVAP